MYAFVRKSMHLWALTTISNRRRTTSGPETAGKRGRGVFNPFDRNPFPVAVEIIFII